MKKLQPHTEKAEIQGRVAMAMLKSINLDAFASILERYGVTNVDPETWYSHRLILDILREIQNASDSIYNMVSIGMEVVDRHGPKLVSTLPDLLFALPQINARDHRHSPYSYEIKQVNDHCIEILDRTPWPHDLVYGMLWQMAAKYSSDDRQYTLERVGYATDPDTGDENGIYHVSW